MVRLDARVRSMTSSPNKRAAPGRRPFMPTAMRSKRSASGASSRRQRVPPALTRGPERFEGLPILDEIKGDLGLVLWRSVRNILLWAGTPAERRGALFAGPAAAMRFDDLAAAHPEPVLLAPLSVIVSLLEHPGTADLTRDAERSTSYCYPRFGGPDGPGAVAARGHRLGHGRPDRSAHGVSLASARREPPRVDDGARRAPASLVGGLLALAATLDTRLLQQFAVLLLRHSLATLLDD